MGRRLTPIPGTVKGIQKFSSSVSRDAQVDITITAVDTNKSVINRTETWLRVGGARYNSEESGSGHDQGRAHLTDSTNLQIGTASLYYSNYVNLWSTQSSSQKGTIVEYH
tara:strand:+ start:472 stop:801 length:330 start_codon:yes stop_codon:yes gene_type:complete